MTTKEEDVLPLPTLDEVFGCAWYVARVATGREKVVAQLMRYRGHQAFVPYEERYRKANRYVSKKRATLRARMPGYVLVGFAEIAMQPWHDLFRLSFVHGVVTDGGGPMLCERSELLRFIKVVGGPVASAPASEQFMRTGHEFREGDLVDVMKGPFKDLRVEVTSIAGEAAKVLMKLRGRKVIRTIPLANMEKA